jgi:hypothetical protein
VLVVSASRGTFRAEAPFVNDTHAALQAQVERWGAEAKRLVDAGREVAALDLYRKAADALPGAPWLQHRTAELARKLKRPDLAILYFRRSAEGFIRASFPKRAVAPLRAAWSVAREGMPRSTDQFVQLSQELAKLQSELGLAADAGVTLDYANDALRRAGFREAFDSSLPPSQTQSERPTLVPSIVPQASARGR